jgi:hypothetical protein
LTQEVQVDEHASEHKEVQDELIQDSLQVFVQAPELPVPHIAVQLDPTQFALQSF